MRATETTHSPSPEEIMEYLDGEGTPASRQEIAAHVASCVTCRTIADEQRGLSQQVRAWSVPPAPDSLRPPATPSNTRVAGPLVFRKPARWILASLSTAAAVLLVVSFGQARRTRAPGVLAIDSITPVSSRSERAAVAGQVQRQAGAVTESIAIAGGAGKAEPAQAVGQTPRTPSIIRTAQLQIVVKQFDGARTSVEAMVREAGGYIDQLTVTGDSSSARALRGSLRVPSDRMADALSRLRGMGEVVEDTQGSEDVTDQIVDLDARLASARATERRLTELLRDRTGRLSDVLEVERELTRVRLDIERLDAEKANIGRRVTYATIAITINEARKARLDGPLSLGTRLRVAAADGIATFFESGVLVVLFILRAGPTLAFWGCVAALGWLGFRRVRDSRRAIR